VYAAQVEVVREAIDRSRERADFTEKAAAMAGFYTAVLALKFSVEGESPDRLPLRGVLLVAFLGLAIAFSAVYLAFIRKGATVEGPKPKGNLRDDQREELSAFVRWCVGAPPWCCAVASLCRPRSSAWPLASPSSPWLSWKSTI
jgi:hypothetical protein